MTDSGGWLLAWAGDEGAAQLEVTASGAAADAVHAHVGALVDDRVASRLFAKDPTLWGPDAEAEPAPLGASVLTDAEQRLLFRRRGHDRAASRTASKILA